MALAVKPEPQLEEALRKQPLRGALLAYLRALETKHTEQLVSSAPDANAMKTLLQGRVQMLAELKELVK